MCPFQKIVSILCLENVHATREINYFTSILEKLWSCPEYRGENLTWLDEK